MGEGRILVVDDEPQIRRVMRATLVHEGYEVMDARSGPDALDRLHSEKFDIILLDINMPGLTGLETCKQIRLVSDVCIIMMTVRDKESDKVAALDVGADDYVTKPFSAVPGNAGPDSRAAAAERTTGARGNRQGMDRRCRSGFSFPAAGFQRQANPLKKARRNSTCSLTWRRIRTGRYLMKSCYMPYGVPSTAKSASIFASSSTGCGKKSSLRPKIRNS